MLAREGWSIDMTVGPFGDGSEIPPPRFGVMVGEEADFTFGEVANEVEDFGEGVVVKVLDARTFNAPESTP